MTSSKLISMLINAQPSQTPRESSLSASPDKFLGGMSLELLENLFYKINHESPFPRVFIALMNCLLTLRNQLFTKIYVIIYALTAWQKNFNVIVMIMSLSHRGVHSTRGPCAPLKTRKKEGYTWKKNSKHLLKYECCLCISSNELFLYWKTILLFHENHLFTLSEEYFPLLNMTCNFL